MALQVSPGINVSEIDLTTVVPTVSTTTGGIAGHFRWGPIETPILISDENQLVNEFFSPNSNTAVDFFTAANFLNYGNQLFVVGVKNTVGANAQNATSNTNSQSTLIKNDEDYETTLVDCLLEEHGLQNILANLETHLEFQVALVQMHLKPQLLQTSL